VPVARSIIRYARVKAPDAPWRARLRERARSLHVRPLAVARAAQARRMDGESQAGVSALPGRRVSALREFRLSDPEGFTDSGFQESVDLPLRPDPQAG